MKLKNNRRMRYMLLTVAFLFAFCLLRVFSPIQAQANGDWTARVSSAITQITKTFADWFSSVSKSKGANAANSLFVPPYGLWAVDESSGHLWLFPSSNFTAAGKVDYGTFQYHNGVTWVDMPFYGGGTNMEGLAIDPNTALAYMVVNEETGNDASVLWTFDLNVITPGAAQKIQLTRVGVIRDNTVSGADFTTSARVEALAMRSDGQLFGLLGNATSPSNPPTTSQIDNLIQINKTTAAMTKESRQNKLPNFPFV